VCAELGIDQYQVAANGALSAAGTLARPGYWLVLEQGRAENYAQLVDNASFAALYEEDA